MSGNARELPPPDWLHNRVLDGVQLLRALGLPGTPAAELATITFTAWVSTIWNGGALAWSEELDSERLFQGFQTAASNALRWPAPREVLAAMPLRDAPPVLSHCPGGPTPEQVQRMKEVRRQLTETLCSRGVPNPSRTKAAAPTRHEFDDKDAL